MPASDGVAIEVAPAGAGDLDSEWFGRFFAAMYEHFRACSGRDFLRPDAMEHWRRNYEAVQGKARLVLIAREDGRPCGFIEGSLRTAPPFFVQDLTGFVSHLYVDPTWRGRGVGDRLAEALNDWFRTRKVGRVELQVVEGNRQAWRFWERRGFTVETRQLAANL